MTIGIRGTQFTVDGQPVIYAGQSCFRLLERFLHKEDITPVLEDYASVLVETQAAPLLRTLRIFGMLEGIGHLHPQDYADYYTSVSALSDWLVERWNLIPHWVVFADAQRIMPTVATQIDHLARFAESLHGRTALLSLGNEYQQNGWTPLDFEKPSGVICARGSALADYCPPYPAWDFTEFHTRRDGIKGQIAASDLAWVQADASGWGGPREGFRQPCIVDEPIGAADADIPNKRSADPRVFYRLAFECAAWGNGGTFHSSNGLDTVPYSETQRACALAWMMALSHCDPVQAFTGV